ncbi:MAG: Fe-S cluster assembly scaffold protein NifU [Clostridia bacterium]|nr:Fe-S cluster assembly scaffold protein NifU [Clostridia bacterium]
MYSEVVMDHFTNPRNVGEMEDADAVADVGNLSCGDTTRIYIKVKDDVIEDIKFKTFGCGAAIASSSIATEMVKGKTLDEALKITTEEIVDALGGLPPAKVHCSVMAADAIKKAIENYREKNKED